VDELVDRLVADRLVMFPDEVTVVEGTQVAGFRRDAQALRARAREAGIEVELVMPRGARPGIYEERTADWVLPLILGVPGSVVATLIATELQRWIGDWRRRGERRAPTVRYREVVIDEHAAQSSIREIEGPADEILGWLRESRDLPAATPEESD
jgi:hypothetical protein